jgi:hypothetical protein
VNRKFSLKTQEGLYVDKEFAKATTITICESLRLEPKTTGSDTTLFAFVPE